MRDCRLHETLHSSFQPIVSSRQGSKGLYAAKFHLMPRLAVLRLERVLTGVGKDGVN